jgi:chromosome segregation and condensation protein ScpB
MKNQTAVEWLEYQINDGLSDKGLQSAIKQAKAMEKEQIIEAYKSGEENAEYYISKCAEQYYKETHNE